jgi:hypothetical protein
MTETAWYSVAWVLAAGLVGFGISALFSGILKFSRRIFLVPYTFLIGVFVYSYVLWSQVDIGNLLANNWLPGVSIGVLLGIFLVRSVRSQPSSRQGNDDALVLNLVWLGLVYGVIDALFINVIPVLVVWQGFGEFDWAASFLGKITLGLLALVASLLVTLAYHLGYPEFRNRTIRYPLIGNLLITLAYLVSANPLGALISHVVMHLAAVVQGPETTIQLPPHISPRRSR